MKRTIARLLVILLVANLFGLGAAEAAADRHSQHGAYSAGLDGKPPVPDGPACSHACHASLHFDALPVILLSIAASTGPQRSLRREPGAFFVHSTAPFRPPRALA